MSLIHYLFLGHFEREGGMVRFSKNPGNRAYSPVVREPLGVEAISLVLRQLTGAKGDRHSIPDGWPIWLKNGYLVCDKYTRDPDVVKFVTLFAERTGCDIYDVAAHCDLALNDWLSELRDYSRP